MRDFTISLLVALTILTWCGAITTHQTGGALLHRSKQRCRRHRPSHRESLTPTKTIAHREAPIMSARRRGYWGIRDRFPILPPFLWLNFSKSGFSWSVHLGIATWNSRRGWHFRGPFGLYWQQTRSRRTVTSRRDSRVNRRRDITPD